MQPAASASPADTKERLLAAAARVIARDGLNGSTTREIAREAGVNEVTLFRHFQTKDRLIAAVVAKNFGRESEAKQPQAPAPTGDLKADLQAMAELYDRLFTANLPLIRTMMGEIHHNHCSQERAVFKGIFLPLKAALQERLEAARQAGVIRAACRADLLADQFAAMLFTGALRRSTPHAIIDYSPADYLAAVVDLTLHGAAVPRPA